MVDHVTGNFSEEVLKSQTKPSPSPSFWESRRSHVHSHAGHPLWARSTVIQQTETQTQELESKCVLVLRRPRFTACTPVHPSHSRLGHWAAAIL